jgi:hypothetical protein
VSEWLEGLAARIDAPLLNRVMITFFNQLAFDIPQIVRFIGHLGLSRPSETSLSFHPNDYANVIFHWTQGSLGLGTLCKGLDGKYFQ